MKHHSKTRKLGRTKGQREALLKTLAGSLIVREKITTTLAKAKELRPYVEKLVTKSKKGDIATRRIISARLSNNDKYVKKLFDVLAPRYADRTGGYTRITKLPSRMGDAAEIAIIEFV